MNNSIKITSAEKLHVQADNETVLAVGFDVLETRVSVEADVELGNLPDGAKVGDEITYAVAHYSHSYPLVTTPEEVNEKLAAFLTNWIANRQHTEKNAEHDAAHAIADETITTLVGSEITG